MKTGIVSVTFRKLSIEKIIEITKKAELECIEWGADVHVKPGDTQNILKVAKLMKEYDLVTTSYGSYYKAGEGNDFETILDAAVILGAPNIRIWAGTKNSEESSKAYRKQVVEDIKRVTKLAQDRGIAISCEYHGGTLTNTQQSTIQLLEEIGMDNLFTYWQPLAGTTHEENKANLKQLIEIGKLKNIHAYQWIQHERFSLEEGRCMWQEYIDLIKNEADSVLLEFVKDDSIEQFYNDAKTLRKMVRK